MKVKLMKVVKSNLNEFNGNKVLQQPKNTSILISHGHRLWSTCNITINNLCACTKSCPRRMTLLPQCTLIHSSVLTCCTSRTNKPYSSSDTSWSSGSCITSSSSRTSGSDRWWVPWISLWTFITFVTLEIWKMIILNHFAKIQISEI